MSCSPSSPKIWVFYAFTQMLLSRSHSCTYCECNSYWGVCVCFLFVLWLVCLFVFFFLNVEINIEEWEELGDSYFVSEVQKKSERNHIYRETMILFCSSAWGEQRGNSVKGKKRSALRLLAWELFWVAAGSEEEISRGGENSNNKPEALVKMGNGAQSVLRSSGWAKLVSC